MLRGSVATTLQGALTPTCFGWVATRKNGLWSKVDTSGCMLRGSTTQIAASSSSSTTAEAVAALHGALRREQEEIRGCCCSFHFDHSSSCCRSLCNNNARRDAQHPPFNVATCTHSSDSTCACTGRGCTNAHATRRAACVLPRKQLQVFMMHVWCCCALEKGPAAQHWTKPHALQTQQRL